ncbi:unnamed protein product [Phaeothamnion confervicola]
MLDRALIHFTLGSQISVGILLLEDGFYVPGMLQAAAAFFDPTSPGRCVSGFCAVHHKLVADIVPPPDADWPQWGFLQWDHYFGWNSGAYLVDLPHMRVRQYHPVSVHRDGRPVQCDLSRTPRILHVVK